MYRLILKRLIDIVIGLVALPFILMTCLVLGIAIKLDDGGPIFYCGERLGKNLKEFKMYKFRSMVINAPDIRNEDGSTFNSDDDNRFTRVGKIIRKLSVDEVPQIINVLKGDMTLIGPRPSPIGNEDLYSQDYLKKFTVRPGITGYTQAYYRNSVSVEEKQKSDLHYSNNISFTFDVKIAFKTILTVFKRKGLYTNDNVEGEKEKNTL